MTRAYDLMTPEEKREYHRINYQKNIEKNREKARLRRQQKQDKIKEIDKKHRQSPAGIKSGRIKRWKVRGVICDDWDALYERYLNTEFCEEEECKCKLTIDRYNTSTTRCLDHDHTTGEVRNILCSACNTRRK